MVRGKGKVNEKFRKLFFRFGGNPAILEYIVMYIRYAMYMYNYVYVNDISNSCIEWEHTVVSEDTNLYMSNSHLQTLYAQVNKEINILFTWFCANKLSLNAKVYSY